MFQLLVFFVLIVTSFGFIKTTLRSSFKGVFMNTCKSLSSDVPKISYHKEDDNTWVYNNHKINYISSGIKDENKPAIVLIHGFATSSYHWRYNILELSKFYNVFAVDLLGFGKSEKVHDNKILANQ